MWLWFLLDGQGRAKSEERSERDNFHHFLLNGLHSAKFLALLNGSFQSLNALFLLYFVRTTDRFFNMKNKILSINHRRHFIINIITNQRYALRGFGVLGFWG